MNRSDFAEQRIAELEREIAMLRERHPILNTDDYYEPMTPRIPMA